MELKVQRDPRLRDKWWRLNHLYKIKDKQGNLVTFRPNYTQLRHLAERSDRKRVKVLKYRQGGFTTLYCIDYLDDALWNPGFSAAIIAHERGVLDKIFQIIERAFDNLPQSVKPKTRQDTIRMLRFDRTFDHVPLDSEIYVALKLRGGTVQALHVAERAYIEGDKSTELEAGSKQAVPITGRISEETTANGMNEFYDSFIEDWDHRDALGVLDSMPYFYAWHEHREYQLPGEIDEYTEADRILKEHVARAYEGKELTDQQVLWYRWKLKDLSKRAKLGGLRPEQLMKQEYPSSVIEAFQSGLGNVFDPTKLSELHPIDPIRTLPNGTLIWEEPQPGRRYVIGADPSGGDTDDETVIDVWDEETKAQVAQWSGLIRPDEAADIAKELAMLYNRAFAGIENNMLSMILFLSKIYDNYFFTVTVDEKTDKRTRKIGWNTNAKTRDPMIDEFRMHFEEDALVIRSAKTIGQMKTFVKKDGGKREHADGKQDDAVIAAMIAVQMTKYAKEMSRGKARAFARKPSGF